MASSGVVIAEIASEAGTPESTVDRMLRVLRPAGLAPMGAPGRSKVVGHFMPRHYAGLLLGFAGTQPSDAAEMAIMLRHYVWRTTLLIPQSRHGTEPSRKAPRIAGDLSTVLEALIAGVYAIPGLARTEPHYMPRLRLIPDRSHVEVIWSQQVGSGFDDIAEIYKPPDPKSVPPKRGVLRETVLTSDMLYRVHLLWQATPQDAIDDETITRLKGAAGAATPDSTSPTLPEMSEVHQHGDATRPGPSVQPRTRKGQKS